MDSTETGTTQNGFAPLPVGFVPVPTDGYRRHRKELQALVQPGRPRVQTAPLPTPGRNVPAEPSATTSGTRVLVYKQDPSVAEIGVGKVFLPGPVVAGPRDARIASAAGIPAVAPNSFGDFIQTPGTDAFDAVHTFAVVRMTLTMFQRALAAGGSPAVLPWQWNSASNTDPLRVAPHGQPNVINAFYSRTERGLTFGDFIPQGQTQRVYTCRSFDIVAHECGHAILDGLKPNWILSNQPPQTGGLHESFGDLCAIFLALSQLDQVEAVIAQTKANLHDKTFLADVAEQFGLALGRPNGLRNADNDLKLGQVGTQVHAISQVFTGAIYDILADIFEFERKTAVKDDAAVLYEVANQLLSLVIRAIVAAPSSNATYASVANAMLSISANDGKPAEHRTFIRNRFALREVVTTATPLRADAGDGTTLDTGVTGRAGTSQDRRACCGTMNNPEFLGVEEYFEAELAELAKSLTN